MMSLHVVSASYAADNPGLVCLTFNDGSKFAVYPESDDNYATELLDQWLGDGNQIQSAE